MSRENNGRFVYGLILVVILVLFALIILGFVLIQSFNKPPVQIVIPIQTTTVSSNLTMIPTEVPTALPTMWTTTIPTPVQTIVPTEVPTAVPTATPTPIPTTVPTEIPTIAPTIIPTNNPTTNVSVGEANLINFIKEINNMLMLDDINIVRDDSSGNLSGKDLYDYVSLREVDEQQLFLYLKRVFINNIAHNIKFELIEGTPIAQLEHALKSCVDESGRVKLKYNINNTSIIRQIFDSLPENDIERANQVMVDFLYLNTVRDHSSENIERLLIVTD